MFNANIQTINSFDQIKHIFKDIDDQTLVVFDCDETILVPKEQYLAATFQFHDLQKHPIIQELKADFLKHVATKQNPKDYGDQIISQMYIKCGYKPVEQSLVDTIIDLRKRNIKVIALTSQETGSLFGGRIARFEAWRYDKLKTLGIDLSGSFEEQDIKFDSFPASPRGKPVFYKGIMCAVSLEKGPVLAALLDKLNFKPSKVIFFDDVKEQVESVVQEMNKRKIACKGYVYRAAYQKPTEVDEKLLRFQFEYMKTHDKVITADEALAWKSSAINQNYSLGVHDNIYSGKHESVRIKSMGNVFVVNYVEHSSKKSNNPDFPAIHITGLGNYNAWLQLVRTDTSDKKWQVFIDTIESKQVYPFYSLQKDFYDAPHWSYTYRFKPLSFWTAHAYAVFVDQKAKTIKCLGGIKWGFKLTDYAVYPKILAPAGLFQSDWQSDWKIFAEKLPRYVLACEGIKK